MITTSILILQIPVISGLARSLSHVHHWGYSPDRPAGRKPQVLWFWRVEFRAAVAHHDDGVGRCSHWNQVEKNLWMGNR